MPKLLKISVIKERLTNWKSFCYRKESPSTNSLLAQVYYKIGDRYVAYRLKRWSTMKLTTQEGSKSRQLQCCANLYSLLSISAYQLYTQCYRIVSQTNWGFHFFDTFLGSWLPNQLKVWGFLLPNFGEFGDWQVDLQFLGVV
jgi:hypothetical protein